MTGKIKVVTVINDGVAETFVEYPEGITAESYIIYCGETDLPGGYSIRKEENVEATGYESLNPLRGEMERIILEIEAEREEDIFSETEINNSLSEAEEFRTWLA